MVSHLRLIFEHPLKLFWALWLCAIHLLLVALNRLLLPGAHRVVSLRTEIARAVLGPFLTNFWELVFGPPLFLADTEHDILQAGLVRAYTIPPNKLHHIPSQTCAKKQLVLLYSHGGGYFFGEPLMHMSTYKRWILAAQDEDIDLTIVSVEYRLSSTDKYPACLEDVVTWYDALLTEYKIPSAQVVLGGDSAGGGLAAMTALHLKKVDKSPPAGLLLISPWLDLEMKDTLHHPAISTDFLITFGKDNPTLVDALLPASIMAGDPRVSPVNDDLRDLPPQFVIAGGAEVLLSDSEKWVTRSKAAGNQVTRVVGPGQMHTYAMGWPICSIEQQTIADRELVRFLSGLGA